MTPEEFIFCFLAKAYYLHQVVRDYKKAYCYEAKQNKVHRYESKHNLLINPFSISEKQGNYKA